MKFKQRKNGDIIPIELIWEIFNYLHPIEIEKSFLVCKCWHLLSTNEKFFREILKLNSSYFLAFLNNLWIIKEKYANFTKEIKNSSRNSPLNRLDAVISFKKLFYLLYFEPMTNYSSIKLLPKNKGRFDEEKIQNSIDDLKFIVLVGKNGSGKFEISHLFGFDRYHFGYGIPYATKNYELRRNMKIDGKIVKFYLDRMYEEDYFGILFENRSDGFAIVTDATTLHEKKSIEQIKKYLKMIEKLKKAPLHRLPLVYVVNKMDLIEANPQKYAKFKKEDISRKLKAIHDAPVFFVSAKRYEICPKPIDDVFIELAKRMKNGNLQEELKNDSDYQKKFFMRIQRKEKKWTKCLIS